MYVDDIGQFVETANVGVLGVVENGDTVRWVGPNAIDNNGLIDDVEPLTFGLNAFSSIQAAISAASAGDTIKVGPGVYTENLVVNKSVIIESTGGASVTKIVGTSGVGSLGTVTVTGNTTGFKLIGFEVIGIDNGLPGIENAAIYFQGPHSNAEIRNNVIVANGDAGLLGEFGAVQTGFVIDNNTFNGQTFVGGAPNGVGFAAQFSLANVPR